MNKQIFFTCVFIMLLRGASFAQESKPCFSLKASPTSVALKEIATIETVFNSQSIPLVSKFKWTISAGEIINGQNTSTITVIAYPINERDIEKIDVRLEIEGLPDGCLKESLTEIRIAIPIRDFFPVGRFENYQPEMIKERLDNFANDIQKFDSAKPYIVAYIGKNGDKSLAVARLLKAKKYLVNTNGVKFEQIKLFLLTFNLLEGRRMITEFWILPADLNPPFEEAELIKEESKTLTQPSKSNTRKKRRT